MELWHRIVRSYDMPPFGHGMAWLSVAWYIMVWDGVAWHGVAGYGTAWHGMV